jgi:nicotinamide-nucleotide amidase
MNTLSGIPKSLYETLKDRGERLVLAESCTGGAVAATLTQIPGISDYFCGSLVTYRPSCKRKWLGVDQDVIEAHTTESPEVACQMAIGALEACEEATWSAGVVGHFDPEAPHSDVFVAVARRTKKGNIKCKGSITHTMHQQGDRADKQAEVTEVVLTTISRAIIARIEKEESQKRRKSA